MSTGASGAPDAAAAAPPAADTPSPADRMALWLFSTRHRWVSTVFLQGALGALFLFAPGVTVALLEIVDTVESRTLFALYGGLLISRAVMEQFVRNARDLEWIRAYMWASLPFQVSNGAILAWAALRGLVNPLFGWGAAVLFIAEAVEFLFVLAKKRAERTAGA